MKRLGMLVLVVALWGCGESAESGMLDSTELVCDDFARYVQDGQPADRRSEVVSDMGEVIGNAEEGVQEGHTVLVNSVDGPDTQWTLAADTFAASCFDAGWDG